MQEEVTQKTIDIALFGKLPLILANCVPPVFFILEIFLCFFGKLQLVQFVDKIITVIFFAADSGIEPVTVKVLLRSRSAVSGDKV